jgi:hypothetical protein
LKGDSSHGLFKSNFVACRWQVPYFSELDLRIGLSFGGGGTGDRFCEKGLCKHEHTLGEMSDNVIVNCSQSASIYINDSSDITISKNVLIGSSGIEVSKSKKVYVSNNFLNGKLRKRNESTSILDDANQYFRSTVSYDGN